jgi:hypothetical protein
MALSTRYASGTIVGLTSLEINTPYPITLAERINTDMGATVLITLQTEDDHYVKYFMPLSFADLLTDNNIQEINDAVKRYKFNFRKHGDTIHVIHIVAD